MSAIKTIMMVVAATPLLVTNAPAAARLLVNQVLTATIDPIIEVTMVEEAIMRLEAGGKMLTTNDTSAALDPPLPIAEALNR